MNTTKIAAACLLAGAMIAAVGFATRSDVVTEQPTATVSDGSLNPIGGLNPIEDVIALFDARSTRQPLDYLSRTQLGLALTAQAREDADLAGYEAAEVTLREALTINPRYEPAQLALASSLHSQHRFVEALDLASSVVESDPRSLSALAVAGDASFELGDYAAAADVYAQLASMERTGPIVSRLARLEAVQGRNHSALSLAEEARALIDPSALRPSNAAFYDFQLAHFRWTLGDQAGTVQALEAALALDPENPGANEFLAFVSAASGDDARAAELYQQLLASGPAADLHGSYADLLRRQGAFDAAEEQDRLGSALAAATIDQFPAERRHLVDFYLTRNPDQAVELAQRDLADRSDIGAYETLAWALHHAGSHDEAAETIELALQYSTSNARLLSRAGVIVASVGDTERAVSLLEEALALNPNFDASEAPAAAALLNQIQSS